MLKIGTLVVTTKGRYGTILMVDENENRYLIKMGDKQHWLYANQVFPATSVVKVKISFEISHCGKTIQDFCEIKLKKDTILYKDGVNNLVQICQEALEKELNTSVKINQIQIS